MTGARQVQQTALWCLAWPPVWSACMPLDCLKTNRFLMSAATDAHILSSLAVEPACI